ncbi:MAG: hypothetical protein ACFFAJ_05050 [Candidatus Hodarchaeota archaeon]
MVLKDLLSIEPTSQNDLNALKKHLALPKTVSEHELVSTWKIIRHMSTVLELPLTTPIKDLINLFKKLKEIQHVFNLQNPNFIQLNVLYVELTTVREMLSLPETLPLADVVDRAKQEVLPSLGIGDNSLLERVLQLRKD